MPNHALRIYDTILDLLSNEENPTPIVRLNKIVPFKYTKVYAKLEWYNPFGAVKDRIAAHMVQDAEQHGLLASIKKLVEPTSGNTGLGLAMVANAKGYSLRTPMSSAIPREKRTILRFFGSEVIELHDTLCPAPGAPEGAIALAKSTAKNSEFHMLNQYENEANPEAHYRTTGPEIWKQTQGMITHFVAGMGTCGTITGTGRFLKGKNPTVQVLGVHPEEGHDIPGVRSILQLQQTKLFHPEEYDHIIEISNKEAYEFCLRLNNEESIIAGPSSGMALAGALKAIPDTPNTIVIIMFPDNIFKYASSVERHFPQFRAPQSQEQAPPSPQEQLMKTLLENARNPYNTLEVDDVKSLLETEKPLVIDVRPHEMYMQTHVPTAINMPLANIGEYVTTLPNDRNTAIVTVCSRGNASLSGMLFLKSLGYKNVRSMNGGTIAWMEKGFTTE